MGVNIIKGGKEVVECNEKLYLHQLYLMRFLSIFWNYVHLLMKLKSHEFGIISLCWNNVFKFVVGSNILQEKGHMCCTIQKSLLSFTW